MAQMLNVKDAKEFVLANYPNDPLLKHIAIVLLDQLPKVEAVEVVRCKDCRFYDNSEGIEWCAINSRLSPDGTDWHSFPEDGYCSYGERRANEQT